MPSYEYRCETCSKTFSLQMRMNEHDRGGISCPDCKGTRIIQVYTPFVAKTSKKS